MCSICKGYGVVDSGYEYKKLMGYCICEHPNIVDGESDGNGNTIWYCNNCHKKIMT